MKLKWPTRRQVQGDDWGATEMAATGRSKGHRRPTKPGGAHAASNKRLAGCVMRCVGAAGAPVGQLDYGCALCLFVPG
jgi:hypothetical protein